MNESNGFFFFPAEASVCEGTNKRKHSMISKKSKYVETDSDEEEEEDKECEYLTPDRCPIPQEPFDFSGWLVFQMQGKSTGELTTRPGSVRRREALRSTGRAKGPPVTGASGAQTISTMPPHHQTSAMVRKTLQNFLSVFTVNAAFASGPVMWSKSPLLYLFSFQKNEEAGET